MYRLSIKLSLAPSGQNKQMTNIFSQKIGFVMSCELAPTVLLTFFGKTFFCLAFYSK